MLQFNINVPSSVYAKYYFDLRALADAYEISFPSELLSKERAQTLEVRSMLYFIYVLPRSVNFFWVKKGDSWSSG